ncbi:MAG: DoxX family protein [Bacteroidia bacterium]|nr:DoxX family protein [Bacteroidia bacterium]
MKEAIKTISRIIIAVLFIYSGFVKCVDPTGTAIKFEEYFGVFGTDFMIPFSMALSILMCGTEMLIGIMLLLNLKIKWSIWIAVLLMAIYTPLTLWLAISNKVTDCGCFGDALVLTNWQTFLKNLVIDLILVVLILNRNEYKNPLKQSVQIYAATGLAVLVAGFEFYNLNHLPVIDFMPYKVGTNIPAAMTAPTDAPKEIWEFRYYYKKNGVQKEFAINNLPDSTWKFVKRDDRLIQKGYVSKIKDFSIRTPDDQDVTNLILSDPGYTLLIVYNSLDKTNLKNIGKINEVVNRAISKEYKVYGLTSSIPEEFEVFKEKAKATYPIYLMDGTTLKTMIRSNPGLILIKNGTVMGKWHHKQAGKIKNI